MPLPDLLKGLAVLLMIQVHITELFVTPLVYDSLAGKISLFLGGVPAAPLFMAVMGYFVVKGGKSSLQLLRRGGQLLIYGLLLNTGLNLHLLIKILNGTYTLNPLEYIFGVDILFLAGYSLIALALLMKMKKYRGLALAGLAVLIAALTPWVSQLASGSGLSPYLAAFIGSYAPWSYFPLFPWLAYPLTGAAFYYLGKHFWVQKYQKYFFIAALLVFVLLFGKGFSVSTTLAAYYHHSLVFYFWAVAFL
ncbi:MAG TPA: heparan-alpha-glucosaminide N-acetyltransferase domain-containing protein, partial [Bacteroidales bacterium]|nr:heparan-alpha-glucosaminide N-acetyltransferase domain-containing protein [Bacteroidales bacterium]